MTLQEAILSKRPFTRKGKKTYCVYAEIAVHNKKLIKRAVKRFFAEESMLGHTVDTFTVEDILSEDWELLEKK